MARKNKLLQKEIGEIMNMGEWKFTKLYLSAILHTEKFDIILDKVFSLSVDRNYNKSFGDVIRLEAYMPLGDFVRHVYPYIENLEISIQKEKGTEIVSDRFKAIFLNDEKSVSTGKFDALGTEELNIEMAYMDFNLVDLHLDKMLQMTTTGISRKVNVEDVMTTLIGEKWDSLPEVNSQYVKTISVIKPHNERKYEQIILPPILPVLDLPIYLQNKDYGVYRGDIGTYIQTNVLVEPEEDEKKPMKIIEKHRGLYIFPLYNIEEETRKKRKLKIFVSNDDNVKYTERTFFIDDTKSIRILGSVGDDFQNTNFAVKRKVGKKDTYIEADSIMTRSFEVETDDVKVDLANHFLLEDSGTFEDKSINVSYHGIVSNKFKLITNTLRVEGTFAKLTWRSSYPDLLHPGMQVEVFYEKLIDDENTLIKLVGILHGVFTTYNPSTKMIASDLVVFVVKKE
jgi:hypothetical protein